ncbi:MAG: N-acetyltransferase [Chitinophagaceae bacterium]|nr:N-acetyltransferase [Chitinophagaceae bacterium]MCW5927518.1 N-acetyltransferase [Chitinophagaceae bacterium]
MKEEFLPVPLIKNEQESRFEIIVEGYRGFIDFKERNARFYLVHTEVASELEGRGVATALIEKTLEYIEQHNHTLIPLCPLIFAYIKRHPEWKRIVDNDFKGFEK